MCILKVREKSLNVVLIIMIAGSVFAADSITSVEDFACPVCCRCHSVYTLPGMCTVPGKMIAF